MSGIAGAAGFSAPTAGASPIAAPTSDAPGLAPSPRSALEPRITFRSLLLRSEPAGLSTQGRPEPQLAARSPSLPGTRGATLSPPDAGDDEPSAAAAPSEEAIPVEPGRRQRISLMAFDLGGQPLAAFVAPPSGPHEPAEPSVRAQLEELLPALVRRIAWSGDRVRGSVRLEIGQGELDGATLLVHAQGGRVRVQLDVPPGVDARRWQQRIEDRLASRGIAADAVEVT